MESPFWDFSWPIFLTGKEGGVRVNERLIFGFVIPAGVFLFSFLATFLIYRRFARQAGSDQKQENGRSEAD
jgi:flagellar biosynthesis/type III secretory pathway M-ring protein FliF/YscJ